MHVIAPYQTAISLFSQDGLVRKYASKTEALRHLGHRWIGNNVGRNFCEFQQLNRYFRPDAAQVWTYEPVYQERPYVLRDDQGAALGAVDFQGLAVDKYRGPLRRYYSADFFWNGEGPVPGTGNSWRSRMFRRPGTQGLRRDAFRVAQEGEPAIRGKRRANAIPTACDDFPRSDRKTRCWKDYRKTQWKAPWPN